MVSYKIATSARTLFHKSHFGQDASIAQMAELVDALGSGPSGGNTVEVRVLFWAPGYILQDPALRRIHCLSAHVTSISSTITVLHPLHLLPAPSFFRQEFHRGVYQGKQGKGSVHRNRQGTFGSTLFLTPKIETAK